MSNVKLAGNVSGTGSVTIASPNTNSDISISLPTVTGGSFIVSDSSGNVGIGTSSPTNALQLVGTAKASSQLYVGSNSDDNYSGGVQNLSNSSRSISIQADPTNSGASTILTFGVDGTEQARITSAGLFQFNSGYGSVATAYGCRAWVNFNGTGTVAIRASGNVTSITDNGTGNYTVNFTTAMPDTNYSFFGQTRRESAGFGEGALVPGLGDTQTTSALQVRTGYGTTQADYPEINVSIFR